MEDAISTTPSSVDAPSQPISAESLEDAQARHRRELRDLQNRITSKKKNATKRTRKGVNDECERLERELRVKQTLEIAALDPARAAASAAVNPEVNDNSERVTGNDDVNDIRAKIAGVSLMPAVARTSDVSPTPGVSEVHRPAGKKRNRQKERLARREADKEASMLAAEVEAAAMVDRRGLESAYMQEQMKTHGLVEEQIQPDGHCLFAAIADQLRNCGISVGERAMGVPEYKVVRQRAADFVEAHADEFAPFLDSPVEQHAATIRDTAEWGGHVELLALARAYGVKIMVMQQEGRIESIGEGDVVLWVAFYRHGFGLGEHYNSLRAKKYE